VDNDRSPLGVITHSRLIRYPFQFRIKTLLLVQFSPLEHMALACLMLAKIERPLRAKGYSKR
jgi:hypothetical protein